MQHLYTCVFLCFFLFSIPLSAQRVVTAPGTFTDAVYVPARDRLYAVTSESGTPANSLCLIDQATGAILESYSVGLNPTQVVATSSGDYLYLGFAGEGRVRRFSLRTNSVDLDFSLGGEEDFDGPYFADDLLPLRGSDDLLAVARGRNYQYPRAAGVVVFDQGIQRQYVPTDQPAANYLTYTDLDRYILGYDNEVYSGLQGYAVTDFSLSPVQYYGSFFYSAGALEYTDGYLYGPTGAIASVNEGAPTAIPGIGLVDVYDYYGVAVEALPETNRIYYLGTAYNDRLILVTYNLEDKSYITTIDLLPFDRTESGRGGKQLLRLGNAETLAFVTADNRLGIVTLCASAESAPPPPYEGRTTFCPGDSLLLTVSDDLLGPGETVLWSDGQTGDSIFVSEVGEYAYRVLDASGCPGPASEFFYVEEVYYGLDAPYIQPALSQVICTGSVINLRAEYGYGATVIWNTGDTTPVLTVTEPGTYVAYGINEEVGCRSYPSESIEITALAIEAPAAPVVEQGLYIDTCTTDLVDLSVDRDDLYYYWTADFFGYNQEVEGDNQISVYPYYERPTLFTVQARDENGCLSPVTSGQVTFRALPGTPTIQYNEATTTLASDLSGPLYWYREDVYEGESLGRYYRPRRNGFYSARKKGPFCLSEPSNLVSVGGVTTAVYDTELSEQVRVFPNPAHETVNVSVGSGLVYNLSSGLMEYRLFSTAGALITTGTLDPQVPSTPISVAGLPAGMYTLTLATREGTMLRKRITVM